MADGIHPIHHVSPAAAMHMPINKTGQNVAIRHKRERADIGNGRIKHDTPRHDPVWQYDVAINIHGAAFPIRQGCKGFTALLPYCTVKGHMLREYDRNPDQNKIRIRYNKYPACNACSRYMK
ncbi:hypothetical protein AA15973_1816 [Komagataeibacter sucrofermentans DSM 15973]|nr:hypothetical protein AA15973_1816 [Komagataeibacter sucrofermentans DSM 15973]